MLIIPSFNDGFAQSAGESAAPEQWRGLVGAWAPFLGVQGGVVYDISGGGYHAALTNMEVDTDWVIAPEGITLSFGGTDEFAIVGVPIVTTTPLSMLWAGYPDDAAIDHALISVCTAGSGDQQWALRAGGSQAGDPILASARTAGSASAFSTTGWVAGKFTTAAGVFVSNTLRYAYCNGGGRGESTVERVPSGVDAVTLGIRGISEPSVVRMLEARLYNRVLSDDEVAAYHADLFALYRRRRRRIFAVQDIVEATSVREWQGSSHQPKQPYRVVAF